MRLYDELKTVNDMGWMFVVYNHFETKFNFDQCMEVLLFEDPNVVKMTKEMLFDRFGREELGKMFWRWCGGTTYHDTIMVEPEFIRVLKRDPMKSDTLFYNMRVNKNQTMALVRQYMDRGLTGKVFQYWLAE